MGCRTMYGPRDVCKCPTEYNVAITSLFISSSACIEKLFTWMKNTLKMTTDIMYKISSFI